MSSVIIKRAKNFHNTLMWLGFFGIVLTSCNSKNSWRCEGNCDNGYGTKIWSDGGIDRGYWKNGKLNGKGFQFFGTTSPFAGDTFYGEFDDSGYTGYGNYYNKSEDARYIGYFKNSLPNGKGRTIWGSRAEFPNGYYDGGWKNGKMEGIGTKYWGTGGEYASNKYVGEWKDDKIEGYGKYYWSDSTSYEGTWKNGQQDGEGNFTFKNGDVFKGHWDKGHCAELEKRLMLHKE